MNRVSLAAGQFQAIRDRIQAQDPEIDEETLSDTVEGLTDLHEILAAVVRSALADDAMAMGLQHRIDAMEKRRDRLQYRAATRRQLVRDVMIDSAIKKVMAPDLTLVLRSGSPSVVVTDESSIPEEYWEPQHPRLNRQKIMAKLKAGADVQGAQLSNPQLILTVRTK